MKWERRDLGKCPAPGGAGSLEAPGITPLPSLCSAGMAVSPEAPRAVAGGQPLLPPVGAQAGQRQL